MPANRPQDYKVPGDPTSGLKRKRPSMKRKRKLNPLRRPGMGS